MLLFTDRLAPDQERVGREAGLRMPGRRRGRKSVQAERRERVSSPVQQKIKDSTKTDQKCSG